MADKLKLIVVTPERQVVEAQADEVQLPGELGYLGILPGHATLVTLLKTGILSYRSGGTANALAITSTPALGCTALTALPAGTRNIASRSA